MDLLIVGTVAYDAIESPYGKTDKILGGAATYIGLAAAKLGVTSSIVSVVGEDFEKNHLDLLTSNKIAINGIEIIKGGETFFWKGKYHNDMNFRDTLETRLNVLENFSPKIPKENTSPSIVMLGNLSPSVQLEALQQLTPKPKLTVLDTMNFWIENTLNDLLNTIKNVDVLIINDEELRLLTNETKINKGAKKIQEMGPKTVIIKRGEYGSVLFNENETFILPAMLLDKVVDPTGAGDSFAGGFVGYLTKSKDLSFNNLKTALVYATIAASFCVQEFGTEGLTNTSLADFENRLNEFKKLTQY
ncbi:MAG: PfkB family carbohydrate kinase [Solirubrobacteraceae bacterium]